MKRFLTALCLMMLAVMLNVSAAPSKSKSSKSTPSKTIVVKKLTGKPTTIKHGSSKLHLSNGIYYSKKNSKYIVTMPPRGLRIATLPLGYLEFRFNNKRYHCFSGVIYQQVGSEYEVVTPEVGMIVPELPQIDDVKEIKLDGKTFYTYDEFIYKPIPTNTGVQYEVVGTMTF